MREEQRRKEGTRNVCEQREWEVCTKGESEGNSG